MNYDILDWGYIMKRKEIRNAVNQAIDNIIYEGCTDVTVFGKPFELEILKKEKLRKKIADDTVSRLDSIINLNENFAALKISKISHMLVPKKTFYDFRKCALIDIVDEIEYLSLVILIANKIEKKRVPNKVAFSYRYKPNKNGRLFEKKYNYSSFKNEYKKISTMKKYKIIVECDISNFYDRLNLHRLNSTLLSIEDIDKKITMTIDQILLFWANRDSYGLPVGSNASRILAEAFLIEIDNYLLSNNIKFCRFVDDYRFFASNISEANMILTKFVEILNKHGLSINLSKTKIRDISDYHNDLKRKKINNKDGIFEVIRGYSGVVPTKFRQLSGSEISKLKNEDELELLNDLKTKNIVEPENIIKCIKIVIAKEKFEILTNFPEILKKYPQFVPYFSDVIFKNNKQISKEMYNSILNMFGEWLNDNNTPEYILISIVKMFDSKNIKERKKLFNFFKNLKRNSGIYIARTVLEQVDGNLSRGEILELKDYFLRADCWEKRQIVKIVLNGLSFQENRPFIKDLKINCNDYFIIEMVDEYQKGNEKK